VSRPAFSANDEQRRLVKFACAIDTPLKSIAAMVGVGSVKALKRHFRKELARGRPEANAKVSQALLEMATSGKSLPATRHWLKCRSGWEEHTEPVQDTVEITSAEMVFVDAPGDAKP
jgi:hypothetical protein